MYRNRTISSGLFCFWRDDNGFDPGEYLFRLGVCQVCLLTLILILKEPH